MLKVKICGITNAADAKLACDLGADALGFIFYEKSPRYIAPTAAASIIKNLPTFVSKVGVFVDCDIHSVCQVFKETRLSFAQIHGNEDPTYCSTLSVPFIKAFRVKSDFDTESVSTFGCNTFLMDAYSKDAYGGSGETFNWDLAVRAKKYGNLILAGGLRPDNILEAISTVQPYAVDISSGVEVSPGKKDEGQIRALFDKINQFRLESRFKNDRVQ